MTISDRKLDRLRLGELSADEARTLLEDHADAVEELNAAEAAYFERFPPEVQTRFVRAKVRRAAWKGAVAPARRWTGVAVAGAALALVSFAAWRLAVPRPTADPPARTETKTDLAPSPAAAARSGDDLFARAEELERRGKQERANAFYGLYVDQESPTSNPDQYLQALVRLGLGATARSDYAQAENWYRKTLTTFVDVRAGDLGRDAAAQAQFMLSERAANQMMRAPLGGEDDDLKRALMLKTSAGKAAQAELEKVFVYQRPRWTIAAHYRIGMLFCEFATSIRESKIPERLSFKQRDAYRNMLAQSAASVEANALPQFEKAVEMARSNGITTPHSMEAHLMLEKLKRGDSKPDRRDDPDHTDDPTGIAAEPESDPELAPRLYSRAMKSFLNGAYEEAASNAKQAIENGCTTKCYRALGMAHYKLGHQSRACRWLQKAGSERPPDLACPDDAD